ncbi:GNAT family N-acetyltransferase [Pseudoroseomonas globiformis]|uniref:GNAT family N-acetyltransferase n=1 Tax=Teichococcus globiformis TaxID=2307229 RepID=A0ABV7G3C7_9PROT
MIEHPSAQPPAITFRHAHSPEELVACFAVIVQLRPALDDVEEWIDRASEMACDGYRVLAAWDGDQVVAVAGYRMMDNLIHGHFLYVDDLITDERRRGEGLGAGLLAELSAIGRDEFCRRLVLDTAAGNIEAQRFYKREGMTDLAIGFIKPLGTGARS